MIGLGFRFFSLGVAACVYYKPAIVSMEDMDGFC